MARHVLSQAAAYKRAPVEVAIETEKQVIAPFCEKKHNGCPAGNGWNAQNGSVIPSPDAGFDMKRNHQELPQEKL